MNALIKKLATLALAAPLGALIPSAASAQEAGSTGSSETQQESQASQQPTQKEKDKTKKAKAGTGGSGEAGNKTEQRRSRPGTSSSGGAAGADTSVPSGGYVSPPHGQRGSPGSPEVYWPNSSTDKTPQGSTGEQAPKNDGNSKSGEGDTGTDSGD